LAASPRADASSRALAGCRASRTTPVEQELAPPGDTDGEVAQLGSARLAEAFLDDEAALEGETAGIDKDVDAFRQRQPEPLV